MKTLKLEVGKTYRNRKGEEVKIVRYDGHPEFPYLGSNDKWYAKNGSFWYSKHLQDLIEEVTMPNVNQNITTKMKMLKLKVGKTYRNRKGEEVKIVEKSVGLYSYKGSNGGWYAENGRYFYYLEESSHDLIEEITTLDANQKHNEMKTLKLQVGKTYRSREGEEVKIVKMGNMGWDYWNGNNGEWYYEGGKWSYSAEEHPKDLVEEVPSEPTRHTFDIPDGVKKVTVEQVGNRIVVEMVPEKRPKPGDVMINRFGGVYIFKSVVSKDTHYHYAHIGESGRLAIGTSCISGRPATPEEAQPLWDALKKAGKRWNPETMQVEKITEIDHICEWVNKHLNCRYYSHEGLTKVIYDYLKYKERKK